MILIIQVADVGESRRVDFESTMTQIGTPLWAAPEVLRGDRYDEYASIGLHESFSLSINSPKPHRFAVFHRRVDTYSFGVVISEVKSRELPFADVPRNQKTGFNPPLIRAIKVGSKRPRNDESWGGEICSLIDRCTRHSPAERPPFGEVAGILKQLYEDSDKGCSRIENDGGNRINMGKGDA